MNKYGRYVITTLLCAAMSLSMPGCSGSKETETFTKTTTGFGGDVTISLEVSDNIIKGITVTGEDETPTIGGQAIETYNNDLLKSLVGKEVGDIRLADIDTVSGASVTSKAILTALKQAINEATGTTEKKEVADGTYTATTPSYSVTDQMTLEVTFADNMITNIKVVNAGSTPAIFQTVENLLIPRIIESQSLSVDAICGATVSSNAMKTIVADTIDQAGGDSSEWYEEIAKSNETVKLEGYDVIVVGLGGSGMTSYVSAAENGATVFGIEKAAKIGGNSTNTSGPMAINPPSKVAANNNEKFVEEEDLISDWMAYTENDAKEELVRLMVEESGETLDWMSNNYNFAFGDMMAFVHPKGWRVWTAYGDKETMNKDVAYLDSMEKAKAMNSKNDYMTELCADELILDSNGNIIGVRATYYDGTIYEIYGDSVILATGGFIGNAEMSEEFLGGVWHTEAMTQCDGAGIEMAESVGGALYNPDVAVMAHIANLDTIIRTDELDKNDKAVLTSLVTDTSYLVVDENGEYFNDKAGFLFDFNAWMAGPNYYVIISEEQMNSIKTNGLANVNSPMFLNQGGVVEPNTPITNLDTIIEVGKKYGDVFEGASLQELAKAIGVDSLDAAVDTAGLSKDGKFYAIKGASYVYSSCGGVDIDANLNVLREDGTPIENLYVVGTDSMGVLFASNKAYVTYGGAAQGWVLTSGRLAGANAAEKYKN